MEALTVDNPDRVYREFARNLDDMSLNPYEARVLLSVCAHTNPVTNRCRRSIRFLAKQCHCARATVKETLVRLSERGLISVWWDDMDGSPVVTPQWERL